MSKLRIITTTLFLLFAVQSMAVAQSTNIMETFKKHFNETVQQVQQTDDADEKRMILNESFSNMITAIDRIESYATLTEDESAQLNSFKSDITENVTLQQNVINLPEGSVSTSNEVSDSQVPVGIRLSQNYPNPFNPTTNIQFGLDKASDVRLEVFNMLGQSVGVLINEQKSAGWHTVSFDASNFSSGIYIYRITANGNHITKRMTLIK